jgi:hypothetical protein
LAFFDALPSTSSFPSLCLSLPWDFRFAFGTFCHFIGYLIIKQSSDWSEMMASPQMGKLQLASQRSTIKMIIAFSCRITMREGVIKICHQDFLHPEAVHQTWISSSISIFTRTCFSHCKSLASVPFQSDSKVQRFENSICTEWFGSTSSSCFYDWKTLSSVVFGRGSKLHGVAKAAFAGSSRLRAIDSTETNFPMQTRASGVVEMMCEGQRLQFLEIGQTSRILGC